MKYIIEHLEPEVYDWCLIEYRHISEIVGKDNLLFTNVKKDDPKWDALETLGETLTKSVKEIKLSAGKQEVGKTSVPKKAILLDPAAEKILTTEDCKTHDALIFGGILGDFPPKKRTEEHFKDEFEKRNLGKEQMPTNVAVYVAKLIEQGKKFEEIEFQDKLTIELDQGEELILPFRFVKEDGKVKLPDYYLEFVKKEKIF